MANEVFIAPAVASTRDNTLGAICLLHWRVVNQSLSPQLFQMHQTRVAMDDARVLTYYDFAPQHEAPPYLALHRDAAVQHPPGNGRILAQPPEMRWNPLLREWTVYAAARMSRPMLPSKDACPLCPGILELPLPYQIAMFENRAPAMAHVPGAPLPPLDASTRDDLFDLKLPASGGCDMVVYAQEHDAKLAQMPVENIACLVEAWRARYGDTIARDDIRYVSIFENKGRDAGMTLDHPHGQIYAFPFLPPQLQSHLEETQRTRGEVWSRVLAREESDGTRIIAQTEGFLAAVPYYARYPYEVHIWARREGVSSLLEMTPQERRELAAMMKNIISRYENLWPENSFGFPTLMLMQQMSKLPGSENYRFHIEYLPLQRSPDKLKFRASIESGTGTFLNDALPETQAAQLREAAPHEVVLPGIVFD
jgi:UDPglucose--hexose-1-phosphate uridylyltransferase